jgi:amino acid transporter
LSTPGPGGSPLPDETEAETLTRNWNELLQELRVTQTGIQVLTGFLLTVPFSNRFTDLTTLQQTSYLVVLTGAVVATVLMLAPVAFHRILFRRHQRPWLVATANRIALAGLTMVALTTGGVGFLVFDIVAGLTAGVIAALVALVLFVSLWVVVPLRRPRAEEDRRRLDRHHERSQG